MKAYLSKDMLSEGLPVIVVLKNLSANAGKVKRQVWMLSWEDIMKEWYGNSTPVLCLENFNDRAACGAYIDHGITKKGDTT